MPFLEHPVPVTWPPPSARVAGCLVAHLKHPSWVTLALGCGCERAICAQFLSAALPLPWASGSAAGRPWQWLFPGGWLPACCGRGGWGAVCCSSAAHIQAAHMHAV
jgi:hypothetical protein